MQQSLKALANYTAISPKLYALFVGTTVIATVGLLDDIYGAQFSPHIKLAGQTIAGLYIVFAGIRLDLLSPIPPLCILVSTIWLVGITNSFNLLDNMDGLSSGIALICSAIFFVLVLLKGEFFIALLLSALIGSTAGFYQFNMRGGFIFMGDSGSLLLGYLLGAVSVMAHYVDPTDKSLFPIVAPVIILGLPLFDTFSVIIIRLRDKRPVFQGDQMHLSHRLVRIGMTRRQAVLFNYLMAFAIAANALLILDSRLLHSVVAVLQVLSLVAMVSILMTTRTSNNHAS
jgi:UDP-GlcNAc:undecaprenyl-phosphate GlcNAc-1-phosphate transferase